MPTLRKIHPRNLTDYFEVLSRAVFQSGISWRVVDAKWDGIRRALRGLEPARVARLVPRDVDRLMHDARIIRNRMKIEATIENARTMLALDRGHKGFQRYLRSHGGFEETVNDLKRQFRFLGETGAYYFLWVVGERVPPHDEWAASRGIKPHAVPTKRRQKATPTL